MKKILLVLILSFFSAQSFAASCPYGTELVKSVSEDGTYFLYHCNIVVNPPPEEMPLPPEEMPLPPEEMPLPPEEMPLPPEETKPNPDGYKPGWKIAEGSNFWSIDEADPYWQTEEGNQRAEARKYQASGLVPAKIDPGIEYAPETVPGADPKKVPDLPPNHCAPTPGNPCP